MKSLALCKFCSHTAVVCACTNFIWPSWWIKQPQLIFCLKLASKFFTGMSCAGAWDPTLFSCMWCSIQINFHDGWWPSKSTQMTRTNGAIVCWKWGLCHLTKMCPSCFWFWFQTTGTCTKSVSHLSLRKGRGCVVLKGQSMIPMARLFVIDCFVNFQKALLQDCSCFCVFWKCGSVCFSFFSTQWTQFGHLFLQSHWWTLHLTKLHWALSSNEALISSLTMQLSRFSQLALAKQSHAIHCVHNHTKSFSQMLWITNKLLAESESEQTHPQIRDHLSHLELHIDTKDHLSSVTEKHKWCTLHLPPMKEEMWLRRGNCDLNKRTQLSGVTCSVPFDNRILLPWTEFKMGFASKGAKCPCFTWQWVRVLGHATS